MRIEGGLFLHWQDMFDFDATGQGATGASSDILWPKTGCFEISAAGAAGGNHSTSYGNSGGGTWLGGRAASARGKFRLERGQMLAIVVGNMEAILAKFRLLVGRRQCWHGRWRRQFLSTTRARWSSTWPLAAAAAPATPYRRPGQAGTNGTDSSGPNLGQTGRGGFNGSAGWTNTEAASYHGGCARGWLSGGQARRTRARRADTAVHCPGTREPEDNGASGGGGGYSGGGAGTHDKQAGGGGGSFCNATMSLSNSCSSVTGGNEASIDGSSLFTTWTTSADACGARSDNQTFHIF
uniref:PE-PGRS family protein n=1 Tax=Macrostomum lignano TaxID=282301 RepID=A0A1I8FE31_9PLAT